MKASRLRLHIAVCMVLLAMQAMFLLVPSHAVQLFNIALRPLVYSLLAAATVAFMGFDARPVRKAYESNMVAIMSVLMFGMVFLFASLYFGAGRNIMASDTHAVMRNLWERGVIVCLGEVIRYKLIKGASRQDRAVVVVMLSVILSDHMGGMRMLIHADVIVWAVFFESVFRPLVISSVSSYLALEGSFLSVLLVSFAYSMTPYLMPVLPAVTAIAWSQITTGMAFITAIMSRFVVNREMSPSRVREKRDARFQKRSIFDRAVTAAVICAVISFFAGLFPLYPAVVLTDSMAGAHDRGSLVFVERVPSTKTVSKVVEGDVIHFANRNGVEYIHRVVSFGDANGERKYVTQGDASPSVDPFPVAQGDVLGIVRMSVPYLGYPNILIRLMLGALSS